MDIDYSIVNTSYETAIIKISVVVCNLSKEK